MRSDDELGTIFRRDLDAAIDLPARQGWRPSRVARGQDRSWKFVIVAVAALVVFAAAVAGPLLAGRQQRLTPAATPSPTLGTGSISGTIRSAATGLPIRGAVINIVFDDPACCRFSNQASTDVTTDEAGRYRQPVSNGRYKVMVEVPLSPFYLPAGTSSADVVAYAPRWWGDAADYVSAAIVEITAGGDIQGIDVALPLGHAISGYVASSNGAGLPTAIRVYAGGSNQCCLFVAVAGVPDGHYAVGVANGVYRIRFRGPPNGPGPQDPRYHYQWWRGADEPVGSREAEQQYFITATDIVVQDADVVGVDAVMTYP